MNRQFTFVLAAAVLSTGVALTSARAAEAQTCSSVSQYGITFSFDTAYPCGTFANGDTWVTPGTPGGTVTVTAIAPTADSGRNGWEVNPGIDAQALDDRIEGWNAARMPTLPYRAAAGQSIVKAISVSSSDCEVQIGTSTAQTCLDSAAVLTVLGEPPPDGGATVFRPPYAGTTKPLYRTTALDTSKLPSLAKGAETPDLAVMASQFQRPWLDYVGGWVGRYVHPVQNMPDYGASIASTTAEGALRLMLDDPLSDRMPLLVNYVQVGIDLYHLRAAGLSWPANGGHGNGRKLPIAFAAVLLDSGMQGAVHDAPYDTYSEDGQVYVSSLAQRALFGAQCDASDYWYNQLTTNGQRDCRDPYGWIDGGEEPGGSYQFCCTSQPWKATALAAHLMPELRCLWNDEPFFEYVDRWVSFGAWTQPDPYAPRGEGALDNDSSDGRGRWPGQHGAAKDDGYYRSSFADGLWEAYRAQASSPACVAPSSPPVTSGCGCTSGSAPDPSILVLLAAAGVVGRWRARHPKRP